MPHLIALVATILVGFALGGCSSLPDGARKPLLNLEEVALTTDREGLAAATVTFTLNHASPEPLKLRTVIIELDLNGAPAARWQGKPEPALLPPGLTQRYTQLVPLDRQGPLARASLARSPMLQLSGDCRVRAVFTGDAAASFNPYAQYRGLVKYGR